MIPFPFYTRLNAQTRFKKNCAYQNQFELVNRNNRFLPFIITRAFETSQITSWKIFDLNNNLVTTINPASTGYEIFTNGDIQYLIYYGGVVSGLSLECGDYYLRITDSENTWYSEVFTVKDISPDDNPYSTLEWKHNHDIGNIIYQTGYINRMYLDIQLGEPEYDHEEEIEKNTLGEETELLITNVKLYKTVIPSLPEYIVDALTLSLHGSDEITLIIPDNEVQITVKQARVEADWINDGCFANVQITFKVEEALIHKTCNDDSVLVEIPVVEPPNPDIIINEIWNETGPGEEDGYFTLSVTNYNEPEFSLDNVNWQSSGTFTGLGEGTYTVYVRVESGKTGSISVTIYENIDCNEYTGATIQDLIDDGIQLGQLYNCTLGDLEP